MLGQMHDMSGMAQRGLFDHIRSRLGAGVRDFVLPARGQTGAINTVTLIIILVAPLVILGAITFVLIVAYLNKVGRVTAELEAKKRPTVCPACGHKLIEIRNFCAECGASIWPTETEPAAGEDANPEEPE